MLNHPRTNDDLIFIAALRISSLFLFRDQRYKGYCILSFDPYHATNFDALPDEEYTAFMGDVRSASSAIRAAMKPDHMNYELLGNSNPHLHWHIVPRYKTDPRWGAPIWEGYDYRSNEFKVNRQVLPDVEYESILQQILEHLR